MLGRRDVLTGPRRFYGAASLCNHQCLGSFDIAGTINKVWHDRLVCQGKTNQLLPTVIHKYHRF